jgi:hypothetical protein
MNFQYPRNKNYIPWEKTEHKRKKTVFLPFHYDIYTRNLDEFKNIYMKYIIIKSLHLKSHLNFHFY